MNSYAYYRLPYSDSYTIIESEREPMVCHDIENLGGQTGYVIAPFINSDKTPIIVIHPDKVTHKKLDNSPQAPSIDPQIDTATNESYEESFARFHGSVSGKLFRKLVLARTKSVKIKKTEDLTHLFLTACQLYPRLMIQLFSTPQTGTWIITSPEILLEESEHIYHTVALAGTMKYEEGYASWSKKNQQEQHIVEQYILDTISPLSTEIIADGPISVRAGNLQHLRTDFRFRLKDTVKLGQLLTNLHPTPAVCGMPKHEAKEFILANEPCPRKYYSGFAGPINLDGETHLYVSLRCAEIQDSVATLYAGGGIMPESLCSSEWEETERKMQTVLSLFSHESEI